MDEENKSNKNSRKFLWVGRIMFCIVFVFTGWAALNGAKLLVGNIELFRHGVGVNAEVVGLGFTDQVTSARVRKYVYDFRFANEDGRVIDVSSQHNYSSWFMPYNDDGTLPILYLEENPEKNRINGFWYMWLMPILILIIWLPIALFGLLGMMPDFVWRVTAPFFEGLFGRKN